MLSAEGIGRDADLKFDFHTWTCDLVLSFTSKTRPLKLPSFRCTYPSVKSFSAPKALGFHFSMKTYDSGSLRAFLVRTQFLEFLWTQLPSSPLSLVHTSPWGRVSADQVAFCS